MKMKLKKDDDVIVIAGRDRGKQGRIVRVLPKLNRVVVSGVNVVKRHRKADKTQAGGITEKELSIHASNVALLDPKQKKATRIGYTFLKDGSKVRVARRSGETLN